MRGEEFFFKGEITRNLKRINYDNLYIDNSIRKDPRSNIRRSPIKRDESNRNQRKPLEYRSMQLVNYIVINTLRTRRP